MASFAVGNEQMIGTVNAKDNGVLIIQNTSSTEKVLLTFLAAASSGNGATTIYVRKNPSGVSATPLEVDASSVVNYDTDFTVTGLGKNELTFIIFGHQSKEICLDSLGIELFENDILTIFAKGEDENLVGVNIRWDEITI